MKKIIILLSVIIFLSGLFVAIKILSFKADNSVFKQKSVLRKASKVNLQAQKNIYLTFDADMTPGMKARLVNGQVKSWYDPELVKYLSDNKIPATIFVTGMFAEVYPNLINDLSNNPNFAIGNHTYDHAAFTEHCYNLPALNTDQQKLTEIENTQDILKQLTGKTPQWFRYPGLCHSEHDDNLVAQVRLKISPGDLVSGDAFNANINGIVKNIVDKAMPGSVVVLHLGGPNAPATLAAIKLAIPELEQRGFNFALLPSS